MYTPVKRKFRNCFGDCFECGSASGVCDFACAVVCVCGCFCGCSCFCGDDWVCFCGCEPGWFVHVFVHGAVFVVVFVHVYGYGFLFVFGSVFMGLVLCRNDFAGDLSGGGFEKVVFWVGWFC